MKTSYFARNSVRDYLDNYIRDNNPDSVDYRSLAEILKNDGFLPCCNKTNCLLHEASTAISTCFVNGYKTMVDKKPAQPSNCDCRWRHTMGSIKRIR